MALACLLFCRNPGKGPYIFHINLITSFIIGFLLLSWTMKSLSYSLRPSYPMRLITTSLTNTFNIQRQYLMTRFSTSKPFIKSTSQVKPKSKHIQKSNLKDASGSQTNTTISAPPDSSNPYSNYLKSLTDDQLTAEDIRIRNLMQDYRAMKAPKKIFTSFQTQIEMNQLNSYQAMVIIKTLSKLDRNDLIIDCLGLLQDIIQLESHNLRKQILQPFELAAAIFLESCKMKRLDVAETFISELNKVQDHQDMVNVSNSWKIYSLYGDLALGLFHVQKYDKAFSYLNTLSDIMETQEKSEILLLRDNLAKSIMKQALQTSNHQVILRSLQKLIGLDQLYDYESCQLLSSYYLKTLDFVKGAVSMSTLPPSDRPEVAFIGRSNVGKSSLINMICNRKNLAYVSNTPGKTSEFNYFAASSGKSNPRQPNDSNGNDFYLVDMPGVGFAKATRAQRQLWLDLLNTYVTKRPSLRVLFHLIDSRHGVLDADRECFELLNALPSYVQYVVVLTKLDKNRSNRVSEGIIRGIERELTARTSETFASLVPVIATSSESKEGGAVIWCEVIKGITRTDNIIDTNTNNDT